MSDAVTDTKITLTRMFDGETFYSQFAMNLMTDKNKALEEKLRVSAEINRGLANHNADITEKLRESQDIHGEERAQLNEALNNLVIATEALSEIREIDWGTDCCDVKNMIADAALEKLKAT